MTITAIEAIQAARAAKARRPLDGRTPSSNSFYGSKDWRTQHYLQFIYGWKLRVCTACNGSGYYDAGGRPNCGSCEGTGKSRYRSEKAWQGPGFVKI